MSTSSPLGELDDGYEYPIDWHMTSHGDLVRTHARRVYQVIDKYKPARNGMGEVRVHRLVMGRWSEPLLMRVDYDDDITLLGVTDWRTDEQRELER